MMRLWQKMSTVDNIRDRKSTYLKKITLKTGTVKSSTQPIAFFFFIHVSMISGILKIKSLTGVVFELSSNAIFPCTFLMGSFSVKNSKRRTVKSQLLLDRSIM